MMDIFEEDFEFEPSSGVKSLVHNIMTQRDYDLNSCTPSSYSLNSGPRQ